MSGALAAAASASKHRSKNCHLIVPLKQIGSVIAQYHNKIPIYPIFYLPKGDYMHIPLRLGLVSCTRLTSVSKAHGKQAPKLAGA